MTFASWAAAAVANEIPQHHLAQTTEATTPLDPVQLVNGSCWPLAHPRSTILLPLGLNIAGRNCSKLLLLVPDILIPTLTAIKIRNNN